jgi:hypothetical protein
MKPVPEFEDRGLALSPRILSARHIIVWIAVAVAVSAPLLLAAVRWPRWWTDIAPEQTPMTWLQSVVLVVAGLAAALAGIADNVRGGEHHRRWLILTAGLLTLAIDERFAIHERIRDGVLAPRGISIPFLPWVAPGDFLILGCAAIGLTLLPKIVPLLRPDPTATRALMLGVILAVIAVGTDSVDPATWTLAQERAQQSLEECIELASGLSLLAAILLRLLALMDIDRTASIATSVALDVGDVVAHVKESSGV